MVSVLQAALATGRNRPDEGKWCLELQQ